MENPAKSQVNHQADRAGIEIKGDNKWLTIIQNASLYN